MQRFSKFKLWNYLDVETEKVLLQNLYNAAPLDMLYKIAMTDSLIP
jgi:hypothetical protein